MKKTIIRIFSFIFILPLYFSALLLSEAIGTEISQKSANISVSPPVEVETQAREQGWRCLTGNAKDTDLNLATDGAYTYRWPFSNDEQFPRTLKKTGPYFGIADRGGITGWIPFANGSLTGEGEIVWPINGSCGTHIRALQTETQSILFDLKKDYLIRVVEAIYPAIDKGWNDIKISVWVKPDKEKDFRLTACSSGDGSYLSGPHVVISGIDSTARYVWLIGGLRSTRKAGGNPDETLAEIRIWGEPARGEPVLKPFRWRNGEKVERPALVQPRQLDEVFVVPQPQEIELAGQPFEVQENTRIVVCGGKEMGSIAEQLQQEFKRKYLLDLKIVKSPEGIKEIKDAIILAEGGSSAMVKDLLARNKLELKREGESRDIIEQAYALISTPEYVLIAGNTRYGAGNGLQTLYQLIRRSGTGVIIAGARIRDWPYIADRAVFNYVPLNGWSLQNWKDGVDVYARLKFNNWILTALESFGYLSHPEFDEIVREGLAYADERGIRVDPAIDFLPAGKALCGGDAALCQRLSEHGPGENVSTVCWTPNPALEEMYQRWFAYAEDLLRKFPSSRIVYLCDPMTGAYKSCLSDSWFKWNVSAEAKALGMKDPELFAYTIKRIHAWLQERGRCAGIGAGILMHPRLKGALELLPRDVAIVFLDTKAGPDPLFAEALKLGFIHTLVYSPWRRKSRMPDGVKPWGNFSWGEDFAEYEELRTKFLGRGFYIIRSEQLWSPDKLSLSEEQFFQRAYNTVERMVEILEGYEFPSWRQGINKEFFCVDLRSSATWSHVDEKAGDGQGWMDMGPNYDLRRLPVGKVELAGIPFEIIDPKKNKGKSVVAIANAQGMMSAVPEMSEIAIGREAASLCFLRADFMNESKLAYNPDHIGGRLPSRHVVYEDSTFLPVLLESPPWNVYNDYWPKSDRQNSVNNDSVHPLFQGIAGLARLAWAGATESGDSISLYISEWVNPYPEKKIRCIRSFYHPEGVKRDYVDVILAITGVVPAELDYKQWQGRAAPHLQQEEELAKERIKGRPFFIKGEFKNSGSNEFSYSIEDQSVCSFQLVDCRPGAICGLPGDLPGVFDPDNWSRQIEQKDFFLKPGQFIITFNSPQNITGIALRGRFMPAREFLPGRLITPLLPIDYKIALMDKDKKWKTVKSGQGICAEDGIHYLPLDENSVQAIRLTFDGKPYVDGYENMSARCHPGVSHFQVYTRGQAP